ncbi:hypothetical protein BDY19DRAFT_998294 [Irpex rosettiformis]|uniref:Uncharacterized protein n=1 Tax=Irpex rosettiformis TaxID=378272 RepID=A0ACB8TP32_9APHY|nr:hypothetical protein BDY19DRAFT_998294 [Irpex rosettiformis]
MSNARTGIPESRVPATPLDKISFVVAGSDNHDGKYSYAEWMNFDIDHSRSAFPMSFMCVNRFDSQDMSLVAPFVASLAVLPLAGQLEKLDRLTTIASTRYIMTKKWSYYAVLDSENGREFITSRWSDARPFIIRSQAQQYKHCHSLLEAIRYAILRGSPTADEGVATDLDNFRQHISQSQIYAPRTPSPPPPRYTPAPTPSTTSVDAASPVNPAPSSQNAEAINRRNALIREAWARAQNPRAASSQALPSTPTAQRVPTRVAHSPSVANSPQATRTSRKPTSTPRATMSRSGATRPTSSPTGTSSVSSVSSVSNSYRTARVASVTSMSSGEDEDVDGISAEGRPPSQMSTGSRDASDVSGWREEVAQRIEQSEGQNADNVGTDEVFTERDDMPYVHLRNRNGRVYKVLYGSPRIQTTSVPSLGGFIDLFLDAFGYEDSLIFILFNARLRARNLDDWMHSVTHMLSVMEAMWMWPHIKIPETRDMRTRHFEIMYFDT